MPKSIHSRMGPYKGHLATTLKIVVADSDGKIELNGWSHVGYYGFSKIYAKGHQRCLVDSKTGRSTFEYEIDE